MMPQDLEDMFSEAMAESTEVDNPEPVEDSSNTEDLVTGDEPIEEGDEVEITSEEGDIEEVDVDEPIDEVDEGEDSEFDWGKIVEQYGDHMVEVTVQGEKRQIPLKDMTNRVMMQEDYTQKTQQLKAKADWAEQVQDGFRRDPEGMIRAFAEAYKIGPPSNQGVQQQQAADPYEDLDPDVAQILRAKDEQLNQAFSKLQQLEQTQNSWVERETRAEVEREFNEARQEFPEVEPQEMLQVAAAYNLPLREAATMLEGRRLREQLAAEQQAGSEADKLVSKTKNASKAKAKKQATSAGRRQHKAAPLSDISTDDFSSIGDLLEMALNSSE